MIRRHLRPFCLSSGPFAFKYYDLLRAVEHILSRGYKSTATEFLKVKESLTEDQGILTKYRWMKFPSCIQFYVINSVLEMNSVVS